MMRDLWQHIRFGFRKLHKSPGLASVIVLTLGLCIGATSAVLGVVRGVFFDPFPYVHHERIVYLYQSFPTLGRDEYTFSVPEFRDLQAQRHLFEHVMAGIGRDVNITGGERPERVHGTAVTASTFDMLGVRPLLGRTFLPEEDRPGGALVVVLSHGLWLERFGGDRGIVGRPIELEGQSYTVIGVMPRRFLWWDSALWFPLQMDASQSDRSVRSLTIMARLRESMTPERAKSELDAMARRVEGEVGSAVPEYRNRLFVAVSLIDEVIRNVRPTLIALQTAVVLILLIACANVANLLLVDLVARSREFAVRLTLGAERRGIVFQVVVEALVLSLLGGLLGFLLASWGTRLIVGLIPYGFIPAETEIAMDVWTFLGTLAISLLVGVLMGLLPALQLLRSNVADVLKEGGRSLRGGVRTSRLRSALVVAEMALGLVLVFGASLMIQTFLRLTAIDPGFDSANVLSMRIDLAEDRYAEPSQIIGFHDRLLERVRALPDVRSAAVSLTLPLTQGAIQPITFEGRSGPEGGGNWEARYQIVAGDYFRTLRIPLVRGRYLDERDTAGSLPVTVINEAMAARFFPGENPVGKRLKRGRPEDVQYSWLTIVGIVEDVKDENLERPAMPAYHVPLPQAPVKPRNVALLVRTEREPETVAEPVRRAVLALDAEQPVFEVQTLDDLVTNTLGGRRIAVVLLSLSALLALLLGTLGIFAVMAHSVSQRTQEIGLRMALGALPRAVFRQVLGEALKLAAVGVVLGVAAAAVSSRLLANLVYGVGTRDPLTLVGASLLFVTVAALASFLPALRATRVAPAVALQPR